MKILHIVPSYKPAYIYGGPIESVAKLCEGLIAAGHFIEVYTTTANGTSELPATPNITVTVDSVPVTYFTRITKDPTHISPALWKSLYKNCKQYDVVHIHSWWNVLVIIAAIICYLRKAKVVISPRGMLSEYIMTATNGKTKQLIHSAIGRNTLRKSYFHATSESEYKECEKLIPGWKGFMIPNILTLPPLEIQKKKHEIFSLLFLSRIHRKKGIEFLLQAVSQLPNHVVLNIAGDGDENYINELKELIASLGITEKVNWLGWKDRTEKFEELMKADLFTLVSYNENFANVVVESLYVGTAVLISDKVGLASFVEKENMGWVTLLDVKAVVQTIHNIMNEKEKLLDIQQRGRNIVNQYFSEPQLIHQYLLSYGKICSS